MSATTSSPRKRRYRMSARADAAAATGERLLDAAWRHFAARPYEDVKLREIAEDAGATVQTLHNRFDSKEAVFTAAFLWWGANEIVRRESAPVGGAAAALKVLFDRYEAHGRAVLRLLAQEERIPAVRQMTAAGRAYHEQWVERTFMPLLEGLRGTSRRRRLAALIAATDLLVWKLLRVDMGLGRAEAEATMAQLVE
jgi:AcrR family transcriptional regulator